MRVIQSEWVKICSVHMYTYSKYIYVAWCLDNLGIIVYLHIGQVLIEVNIFSCNLHTIVFFYCIL